MPAEFNVHDGLIDIMFTWPNIEAVKAQDIIYGCALYRWRLGEGPTVEVDGETVQKDWDDLTNQEKLNLAYRSAQKLIIAEAQSALVTTETGTARDTALDYAQGNYVLPE
jgi:hypothetical protein